MLLTFSGALNLDIICEIESLVEVSKLLNMELVHGREYVISHKDLALLKEFIGKRVKIRYVGGGGSSANTCVALTRLGYRTSFIGACGEDDLGDLVLSSMEGVNLQNVKRVNKTASCVIFLTKDHKDRTILVAPGESPFELNELPHLEFLHLSSLPSKKGVSFHKELVKRLTPDSILTLDPGEIYSKMGIDALSPILTRTNILFITLQEYEMLFGNAPWKQVLAMLTSTKPSAPFAFKRALVIKKGPHGSTCYLDQGKYEKGAERIERIVDNTGAGDAFNAGFLHAWLRGEGPEACLWYGNRIAALSLQDWGRNWMRRLKTL